MLRNGVVLGLAIVMFAAGQGNCNPWELPAGAENGLQGRNGWGYRSHFFNYPHAIPPDYVYRTGRVFSPQNEAACRQGKEDRATERAALPAGGDRLQGEVRMLARQLLANAREEIDDEYVLTVSTFVNLNNLYATSALGRYIGEQLITELQLAGIDVIDVRKTPGIMVSEGFGEYGLSRDMDELRFVQPAAAMVVGTYTVADGQVLLNARLLRNSDGMALSAASSAIAVDKTVGRLLADEGMPVGTGSTVQMRAFDR